MSDRAAELSVPSEAASRDRAELTRTMMLTARSVRAMFDAQARDMGLTFARAQAILAISRDEGMSQRQLAETLVIETPTLNRTLDGLEKLGFVERRADPKDKRVRQIFLTDHARANASEIETFVEALRAQLYEGLDADEVARARKTMERMQANLERMRGQ